ncbi:MAG: hypothetical protein RMJ43_06575 [Chloroherpetonaceae bacterium]|nr:hypothetical protein [Chthonomonadaceae bacterium]MDW8207484.1 hypothetical protein [Chloroherpetonaceae bacterium]
MRHRNTRSGMVCLLRVLTALALLAGSGATHAQINFNALDWLLDRGNSSITGGNGTPWRPGYNDFLNPNNFPGYAVRRWVWPFTRDLNTGQGGLPTNPVVDNPNPADPRQPRTQPQGLGALSVLVNGPALSWAIPAPASRAPGNGYSITLDPSAAYNFDYAYVPAIHNDFQVQRPNGQTSAVTDAEWAALPNVPPNVYRAVHETLVNTPQPYAIWTAGAIAPGRYSVQIYSPGSGTLIPNPDTGTPEPHPNVRRALVRVSWANTVAGGNPNMGGINDPRTSRIFVVNLDQAGWITLQGGGLGPASFPYDGNPNNQITVTLYALTPDRVQGNPGEAFRYPLVTADAIRLVPQALSSNPALGEIAGSGRILGATVATSKLSAPLASFQPYVFVAREESVPETQLANPPLRSYEDPTDSSSAPAPDPTAMTTAPVFYCIDNRNGNTLIGTREIFSIEKVRWRYVGASDGNTGTAAASPLLANVRCRDGVVRPMVFFATTNQNHSRGRVYALDPSGDPSSRTTFAYWVYPSIRPLTAQELQSNNFPAEYHDPNYRGYSPGDPSIYPQPTFGPDQNVLQGDPGSRYYDGEIVRHPTEQDRRIVRTDTRISFGGVLGSPLLLDDPSNLNGPQILIVPSMNGRVYALDAGGRGDFSATMPGTTQRLWAWPRFGADAYYTQNRTGTNTIRDEPSKVAFPTSPAFDPTAGSDSPVILGAADGRMYGISARRDDFIRIVNNVDAIYAERRVWIFPGEDRTLGVAPSTVTIFQRSTTGEKRIFFTAGGRVYALNPVTGRAATTPAVKTAEWIYPYTPAPPNPDPNDASTTPLDPGFNGSAPVVLPAGATGLTRDVCYVLQSNGTLIALDAFPATAPRTTVLATGQTPGTGSTRCSPIAVRINSLPELDTALNQTAIVFADDDGGIHAFGAVPRTDAFGNFLPLLWQYYDSGAGRPASAILASTGTSGMIIQGDEGGQLRAYGVGVGINGLDETVGSGEPAVPRGGAGDLSIDLRVLDFYRVADFNRFALAANDPNIGNALTPGRNQNGNAFARSATPLAGNLGMGNGALAADWGEFLHVAAWGVYHAVPTDPMLSVHGVAPPTIRVTFTVQSGRGSRQYTVIAPLVTDPNTSDSRAELWPDDAGVTDAEKAQLAIFGTDPNSMDPNTPRQLQGPGQYVFPWVAKVRIPIDPGQDITFSPGSPFTVTARAELTQNLQGRGNVTVRSNILRAGQTDWEGMSQGPVPTSPNQRTRLGAPRRTFVLNPLALSVRGMTAGDMTGAPNVIGASPSVGSAALRSELLGNGNRLVDPATGAATLKSLYAPAGMIPDGTTAAYFALNGAVPVPALYLADRSSLFQNLGKPLRVQAVTRPLRWFGDPTSVMNPLPWEQLPLNGVGTPDYPNIGPENVTITTNEGQSLIDTAVALTPRRATGELVPVPLNMQISVPRYQPANVNWGFVSASGPAIPRNFGANYQDVSGNVRTAVTGPLATATGLPVNVNDPRSYPAAGYISEVVVRAETGQVNNRRLDPNQIFTDLRLTQTAGATAIADAYRAFELGITVPPAIRMRVAEQTLDVGKVPHGMGYSYYDPGTGRYRLPFAPTGTGPYQGSNISPWDGFFLPFTLYNESNINLFDVRVAKLTGPPGAAINAQTLAIAPTPGVAFSERLVSDQVNPLTSPPIFAAGFNFNLGGVGNIGVISSFDHASRNSALLNELPLWPVANPYVTASDVNRLGYGQVSTTVIQPNQPWSVWQNGFQPHPVVIKPRVGDTQGPFATVPAAPYGTPEANDPDRRPKVSVAVPPGTPVGTYASRILVYEDHVPFQWRAWLAVSGQPVLPFNASGDAILNTDPTRSALLEPAANPTFTLKVTVREARLTEGVTAGTLSQIDPVDPRDPNALLPVGANLQPAAALFPTLNNFQGIYLWWTTNRRRSGNFPPDPAAPWSLVQSLLPMRGGNPASNVNLPPTPTDTAIARVNAMNPFGDAWWTAPSFVVGDNPALLSQLFPSAPNVNNLPFLPGVPEPATERHFNPSVALAVNPLSLLDSEAYLFWQGTVDKRRGTGATGTQVTDSRTFYQRLVPGAPAGAIYSFQNDPALTKLSPKPLFLKLPGSPATLYLFWHGGGRAQTSLYYNVSTSPLQPSSWSPDQKLPMPGGLVWQSDPQPIFRTVRFNGQNVNAIDVIYTGVLRNRQIVELLLSRYRILADRRLALMDLPQRTQETLTRLGATSSYAARDAGWVVRTRENDPRVIRIDVIRRNGQRIPINLEPDGSVQIGRFDEASGLLYFNSALGGVVVVDTRGGVVTFPNVPPQATDRVVATYTPQIMRLNTSRDDSGIVRTFDDNFASTLIGNFRSDDPAFAPRPAILSSGNNTNPVAILDQGVANSTRTAVVNPRLVYTAPRVIFPGADPTRPATLSRLWVLYRKSDPQGTVRAGLYYKALRLMVHLPRPVALTPPDASGSQQIANLTVTGNIGPVEVDWVRGRLYFTDIDEGSLITVSYLYQGPNGPAASGPLTYRVSWCDEISATGINPAQLFTDFTTPEAPVPTDTAVNEGQVAAFKDPFNDKLWVFWTSTRAGTTDLYYQTIAPLLYPVTSNQR